MGKVAFVFPGKRRSTRYGQRAGREISAARAVFDEADKALGFLISKICLQARRRAQAHGQHAAGDFDLFRGRSSRACREGFATGFCGRAQLGRVFGASCAGSLKFADAVQLVRKRGTYMQEAVPAGVGAMAAIHGLSHAVVADACKRAAEGEVCGAAN